MRVGALVFAVALVAAACTSQEKEAPRRADCPESATTLELRRCYARLARETDAEVAARARAVDALLNRSGRRQLAAAEAAWRSFRDGFCAARASTYAGGSAEPLVRGECVVHQNRRHAAELRQMERELRRR